MKNTKQPLFKESPKEPEKAYTLLFSCKNHPGATARTCDPSPKRHPPSSRGCAVYAFQVLYRGSDGNVPEMEKVMKSLGGYLTTQVKMVER